MPRSTLPPLAALRAFEACARHVNFTLAASELGLTQAAVSYQIKVLEDRVGQPLFFRKARGVELTPIGATLASRASEAMDILSDAFAEAKGATQGTLAINSIPTFATSFLATRLGRFQMAHPKMAVRVEMSETLIDFRDSEFDMAIRAGHGGWDDLISHKLVDISFSPMLSPALAKSVAPLDTPKKLLQLPILAHGDPWWRIWFTEAGLSEADLGTQRSRHYGSQVLEATAAIEGHGVAMLTPSLFDQALRTGQLVQPFELASTDGSAYWLVYSKSFRNSPKIKAFRNWLDSELAEL